MNMILVWMVSRCDVYVIPESIRRKDFGYEGYEPRTIANFVVLPFLAISCLAHVNSLYFHYLSAQRSIYFLRASDSAHLNDKQAYTAA